MARKLVFIVMLILLLPALYGIIVPAPIVGNVSTFDDSDTYKIAELSDNPQGKVVGYIDIPKRAVVTKASFNVTTMNTSAIFPKDILLDIGDDKNYEWAFIGDGYGALGQQQYFVGNKTEKRLKITGDDHNTSAVIRLPKNATVTSTMMLIDGRANISGADPTQNWKKMKSSPFQSSKVVANISGGPIYFARYGQKYFDIYYPNNNTWKTSSNCNDAFSEASHAITLAGDEIYVVTRSSSGIIKLHSYGINNDTWTDHGTLPNTNFALGALTYDHGNNIYAIERMWTPSSNINFYNYSISKGTWTKLKSPWQTTTQWPTLCYLKDKIYMMNYTWFATGREMQRYDPALNSWENLTSSPANNGIISRICTDGYNIFGVNAQGRILKYDVPTDTWVITGKSKSGFISSIAGFAYSDRKFYLGINNPTANDGYYNISGLGGGEFPFNATLNIGDNGAPYEWNITGEFNTTDYVSDFTTELNNIISGAAVTYKDKYGNEFVDIPINITSNITSEFAIRQMYINYTYTETVDMNPSTGSLVKSLNELIPDTGEGNITLPIIIYSTAVGDINISDISIDYYIPELTNIWLQLTNGYDPDGKVIYADHKNYTFSVKISNFMGYADVKDVTMLLDVTGENLQLFWNDTTGFSELRDPLNLITLDIANCASSNDGKDNWTLTFSVRFDWAYPNENLELCALNTTNDTTGAWIFNYFEDVYRVENDLDLIGNLDVTAKDEGKLIEDNVNNWVHASEEITWSNLTVVYEDTTDIYPHDRNFNITITDDDSGIWVNSSSSGNTFSLTTVSDPASDYFDTHYINITNIPGLGQDVSNWTFMIKIDNDGANAPTWVSCHADTPNDQSAADDDTEIYVKWGPATDPGSGVTEYAMEFKDALPTTIKVSGDTATGEEGLATFYVRGRDKVGNWGAVGSGSIFIDQTNLTYGEATPTTETWLTNRTVQFTINILDTGGSGVDIDTVQFRKSEDADIDSAPWNGYNGQGTSGENVVCSENITFAFEGVDKTIQWRAKDLAGIDYINSEPYQFKIDSVLTTVEYIEPDLDIWLDSISPTISVYINDTGGSGVDLTSIQYSISTTGPTGFGSWLSANVQGVGESVKCTIDPTFEQGDDNFVRFYATDIAGNEFISTPRNVKIDVSDLDFLDPRPTPEEWSNSETVTCQIYVRDLVSSVELSSLRYQFSTNGTGHYSYWRPVSNVNSLDEYLYLVTAEVKFKEGSNNYIRWQASDLAGRLVTSEDYRVQIDITPIRFGENILVPHKEDWFNTLNVKCSISINDTSGSGVLASTVEYSISTSGPKEYLDWTQDGLEVIDLDLSDNTRGETDLVSNLVLAQVTPQFVEGTKNFIRWRGSDLAGTPFTHSEPQQVNIDLKVLEFSNPVPAESVVNNEHELLCRITIKDIGGSGVDTDSIEYRFSNTGKAGFSEWMNDNINNEDQNNFFVYLYFNEGPENYIMWRASDQAGNGPVESEVYKIIVNSPPSAKIDDPRAGQEFMDNELIFFDASSSVDPDATDILGFQWESNISKLIGEEMKFETKLLAGVHKITLTVTDHHEHIVQDTIEIIVKRYVKPVDNGNTTPNITKDDNGDKKEDTSNNMALIGAVIIVIVIALIAVAVIVNHKRSQKKTDDESVQELVSHMPVTTKASGSLQTTMVKNLSLTSAPDTQVPALPPGPTPGAPSMPATTTTTPATERSNTVPQYLVPQNSQIPPITPVQLYTPQPLRPTEPPLPEPTQIQTPTQTPTPTQPKKPGRVPGLMPNQ